MDPGRIYIIAEISEPIRSVITKNFQLPLSMDHKYPLHIPPYNIVANITRSQSDPSRSYSNVENTPIFGSIFVLSITYLLSNCMRFCNLVPQYINAKLKQMGGENLISRVLVSDSISDVSQYEFYMDHLSFTPTKFVLPRNEHE